MPLNPKKYLFDKHQLSVKIFHKETNTTEHTSYFVEHTDSFGKWKSYSQLKTPTRKHSNTCYYIYIPRALNTETCINYLQWRGAWWPILYCESTQLTQEKLGKGFEKNNAVEWTGRLEISSWKKSLADGEACMAIFWPAPGFKERTFKRWVFKRWIFTFCVGSTRLGDIVLVVVVVVVVLSQRHNKWHTSRKIWLEVLRSLRHCLPEQGQGHRNINCLKERNAERISARRCILRERERIIVSSIHVSTLCLPCHV